MDKMDCILSAALITAMSNLLEGYTQWKYNNLVLSQNE